MDDVLKNFNADYKLAIVARLALVRTLRIRVLFDFGGELPVPY